MITWFYGSGAKASFFQSTQQTLAQFLTQHSSSQQAPQVPGQSLPGKGTQQHGPAGSKVQHAQTWHPGGSGTGKGNASATSSSSDAAGGIAGLQHDAMRLPGLALYYTDALQGVPHTLSKLAAVYPTLPQVNIFLTNRSVPLPEVLPAERLLVQQLEAPGFWHVIARYGYAQRKEQGDSFVQDVMRHIQALLYRSLRHRLLQGKATAPLAKRHSVGPEAAAVVDAAVGDIHGEGHHTAALTLRSVIVTHMALSAGFRPRPGVKRVSPAPPQPPAGSAALGSQGAAAAAIDQASSGIASGIAGGSGVSTTARIMAGGRRSSGSSSGGAGVLLPPGSSGSTGTAGRWAAAATAAGALQKRVAFEAEMHAWALQILKELTRPNSGSSSAATSQAPDDDLEPLRRLAAELALVAAAAQAGTRAHVLGRSRGMALPPQPFLGPMLRYWGLQLPFLFLAKTTEQDVHTAWGIPEARLLECGLIYKL